MYDKYENHSTEELTLLDHLLQGPLDKTLVIYGQKQRRDNRS